MKTFIKICSGICLLLASYSCEKEEPTPPTPIVEYTTCDSLWNVHDSLTIRFDFLDSLGTAEGYKGYQSGGTIPPEDVAPFNEWETDWLNTDGEKDDTYVYLDENDCL